MSRLVQADGRRGTRTEKDRKRDLKFWDNCRQKNWDAANHQLNSDNPPTSDHLDQYDGILAYTYANLVKNEIAEIIKKRFPDVTNMELVYYSNRLRRYCQEVNRHHSKNDQRDCWLEECVTRVSVRVS